MNVKNNWHNLELEEIFAYFQSTTKGLTDDEVIQKRNQFGSNALPTSKRTTIFQIFIRQFLNPLIFVLVAAAFAAIAIGESGDSLFIFIVIYFMKHKFLCASALFLGLSHSAFAMPFDPLIGTWKVIDDRTGYYISDIVIRKNSKTSQYSAVVTKYYPLAGAPVSDVCSKCQGGLKDKPIFGMQVLNGLMGDATGQKFAKGQWLNPQDGRVYNINTAQLNAGKDQMKVQATAKDAKGLSNMTWKKL